MTCNSISVVLSVILFFSLALNMLHPTYNGCSVSFDASVSAYDDSTGDEKYYGITASGEKTQTGFVAAGYAIPFGIKLYIPGFGGAIVKDRGGMIENGNIDIWMSSYQEAINFGRSTQKITLYP